MGELHGGIDQLIATEVKLAELLAAARLRALAVQAQAAQEIAAQNAGYEAELAASRDAQAAAGRQVTQAEVARVTQLGDEAVRRIESLSPTRHEALVALVVQRVLGSWRSGDSP
jgi:restriction endonuclease Mrr